MKVEAEAPTMKEISEKYITEPSPRAGAKDNKETNIVPVFAGEKYN